MCSSWEEWEMDQKTIIGLLTFFQEAEALKSQNRTAWLKNGKQESVADHSWRLCLMAMCLCRVEKEICLEKVLKLCIIHDLGEADEGDISAIVREDKAEKLQREEKCLNRLLGTLDDALRNEIITLHQEYNEGLSEEAKLVRGMDKLETLIQHNQGKNPKDFNYAFNLKYGQEWTGQNELLAQMREMIDKETKSNLPSVH